MSWAWSTKRCRIEATRSSGAALGRPFFPLLILAGVVGVPGCVELQQALYPPHPTVPDRIVFFQENVNEGEEPPANDNTGNENENENLSGNDNLNENIADNDNSSEGIPPLPPGIPLVPTNTGLQIAEIQTGTGEFAALDAEILVNYTGWLLSDESIFDMQTAASFVLGDLIQGWQEGVLTMREGGIRRLIIPPELAYGAEGRPGIPPNSTLVFDIELIEVDLP